MKDTRIVLLVETRYSYSMNYPAWQYRVGSQVNNDIEALEKDGYEVVLGQPNTTIVVLQRRRRE